MQRALTYAVMTATTASLLTGCQQTPPSFLNLGTESATEGLTGDSGANTTAAADTVAVGDSSSSGSGTTAALGTSTGAESSSDDNSNGSICGDGVITGVEDCDCGGGPCTPEGLGDKGCADASDPFAPGPLTGGVLGCNPASCKFILDECTACGDKELNGDETCEYDMEIAESCMSLGKGAAGDLTCTKECQIDTSACTACGAEFEFDDCLDPPWFVSLTHGSAPFPSWACGVVSGDVSGAPPANGETVWATGLDSDYLNQESGAVFSQPIDLTSCGAGETVQMRITHWMEFEGGITNTDGGIVQVSAGGNQWTTITPVSGALYNQDQVLTTAWIPPDNSNGFSGNSLDTGMWVQSAFDVSSFAGTSDLQVRFVFGSDSGTTRAGWYIDRVEFVGGGA